jgi:hypothetical protein
MDLEPGDQQRRASLRASDADRERFVDFGGYFWPVWPMLGWGIGVARSHTRAWAGR